MGAYKGLGLVWGRVTDAWKLHRLVLVVLRDAMSGEVEYGVRIRASRRPYKYSCLYKGATTE